MDSPLLERRDYGEDGKDDLDKNFEEFDKFDVPMNVALRSQFKKRRASIDSESVINMIMDSQR